MLWFVLLLSFVSFFWGGGWFVGFFVAFFVFFLPDIFQMDSKNGLLFLYCSLHYCFGFGFIL